MAKEFIDIDEMRFIIKKLKYDKKLKRGVAYLVDNAYALPYRGAFHSVNDCREEGAGIYYSKQIDDYVIVKPFGKKNIAKYSIDNIYQIDDNYINTITMQEGITSDMGDDLLELDSGNIFAPSIEEQDNMCQRVLKDILSKKRIDLKAYMNRFGTSSNMGNYKRSLLHHGLQTDKFIEWLDILDVDYEIVYRDKEDCQYPMGGEDHLSSDLL